MVTPLSEPVKLIVVNILLLGEREHLGISHNSDKQRLTVTGRHLVDRLLETKLQSYLD